MDPKQFLHRYLGIQRDALLAKLDGVGERVARWPMTPTGTNLLGLIKHVASIELGYFGEVFDRPSNLPLPWFDDGAEINADMWPRRTSRERRSSRCISGQQAIQMPPSRPFPSTLPAWFRGGPRSGSTSLCTRSWCMSALKSLGTPGMPTSSVNSSTARPGQREPPRPECTRMGELSATTRRGGCGSCAT
jgi:hypothetical protein